jgi:hypothetical protein
MSGAGSHYLAKLRTDVCDGDDSDDSLLKSKLERLIT